MKATTTSIGIRKWAGDLMIQEQWRLGVGDSRLIGWRRIDGERAVETNADPIFPQDMSPLEFEKLWIYSAARSVLDVPRFFRNG